MPQVIGAAAVVGMALLLGSVAAWRPAGLPEPPDAAALPASTLSSAVLRCGGKPAAAVPAVQALVPNEHTLANGHAFALACTLVCAHRLHATPFPEARLGWPDSAA